VPKAEPFVDIHCHLVPGIDDGSKNWEETLEMAYMAVGDGFRTMVVTPHQLGHFAQNTGDLIRARTAELQKFLNDQHVPLEVLPGGDVRIEAGMAAKLKRGEVMSLADKRKHVLLELPHELYVPLDRLLVELAGMGMVGILSHPERNEGVLNDPAVLKPLVDAGCLMQVTAGSVLGAFGPNVQKFSAGLIEQGLVHFISTDAHGTKSRRPLMKQAFDRVAELAGLETALELCCRNPGRVAQGKAVTPGRREVKSRSFGGWFGRKKAA